MPLDRLRGRLLRLAWAATAVLAAVSAVGCSTGRSAVQADLLLSHGIIYTVDAERSRPRPSPSPTAQSSTWATRTARWRIKVETRG